MSEIIRFPLQGVDKEQFLRKKASEYKQVVDALRAHCPPSAFTDNAIIANLMLEYEVLSASLPDEE